jgi:hypothetical protein
VIALLIFRPKGEKLFAWPSRPHFAAIACIATLVLGLTTPILALNEPAKSTSTYEVLEPESWVGKKLPILEHIDIAESFEKGTWLILFHRHDCHDCAEAVPRYEQMARDLAGSEDILRMALIEIPPYGRGHVDENSPCVLGRLADTKEWFVTTPAVALLANGQVKSAWEGKAPDFDTIFSRIVRFTGKRS